MICNSKKHNSYLRASLWRTSHKVRKKLATECLIFKARKDFKSCTILRIQSLTTGQKTVPSEHNADFQRTSGAVYLMRGSGSRFQVSCPRFDDFDAAQSGLKLSRSAARVLSNAVRHGQLIFHRICMKRKRKLACTVTG